MALPFESIRRPLRPPRNDIALPRSYCCCGVAVRRLHGGTRLFQAIGADDGRLQGGPRVEARATTRPYPARQMVGGFWRSAVERVGRTGERGQPEREGGRGAIPPGPRHDRLLSRRLVSHGHRRSQRKLCAQFDGQPLCNVVEWSIQWNVVGWSVQWKVVGWSIHRRISFDRRHILRDRLV